MGTIGRRRMDSLPTYLGQKNFALAEGNLLPM